MYAAICGTVSISTTASVGALSACTTIVCASLASGLPRKVWTLMLCCLPHATSPSQAHLPKFGSTLPTQDSDFAPCETAYCAAPRPLRRGPWLIGAMLREWKHSRVAPTDVMESTF